MKFDVNSFLYGMIAGGILVSLSWFIDKYFLISFITIN